MAKAKVARKLAAVTRESADDQTHDGVVPPKMAIRLEFGRRLRAALQAKGWKQIDLANATDIGRDSISGYSRGRVLPDHDRLEQICKALGTTPEKLVPHYGVDEKTADLMPALEIKQAEEAGMVWVRINQVLSLDQVSRIMAILQNKSS
jgi:transcriptional regulator with XRE-family HTH domain